MSVSAAHTGTSVEQDLGKILRVRLSDCFLFMVRVCVDVVALRDRPDDCVEVFETDRVQFRMLGTVLYTDEDGIVPSRRQEALKL